MDITDEFASLGAASPTLEESALDAVVLFEEIADLGASDLWTEARQREWAARTLETAKTLARLNDDYEADAVELVDRVRAEITASRHHIPLADLHLVAQQDLLAIWTRLGRFDRMEELLRLAIDQSDEGGTSLPLWLLSRAKLRRAQARWLDAIDDVQAAGQAYNKLDDGGRWQLRVNGFLFDRHRLRAQAYQYGLRLYDRAYVSWGRAADEAAELTELCRRTSVPDSTRERVLQYASQAAFESGEFHLVTGAPERVIEQVTQCLPETKDPRLRAQFLVLLARAHLWVESAETDARETAAHFAEEALSSGHLTPAEAAMASIAAAESYAHRAQPVRRDQAMSQVHASLSRLDADEAPNARLKAAVLDAKFKRLEAPTQPRPKARAALGEAFQRLLVEWDESAQHPGGINFLHHPVRRACLVELMLAWSAEAHVDKALAVLCSAQQRGTLSRSQELPTVGVEELRRSVIPDHGGLLSLVTSDGASLALVIDHDAPPEVVLLPPEPQWKGDVARLHAHVRSAPGNRDDASWKTASRSVAHAFFPTPLRDRVQTWSHWVIDGASLLDDLALDAVLLDDTPVGLSQSLTYVASLPVAAWTATQPAPSTRSWDAVLVQGDSNDEAGGQAPPWNTSPLMDPWGPHGLRLDFATFLESPPTGQPFDASYLHVLAHGRFDNRRDVPPGLLVQAGSPASVLWADGLDRLPAADVVLLSACGAARGKERLGEDGLSHLGGQFTQRGARSIVLANCRIEDTATLLYARAFEEHLRRGATTAAAHQSARLEVASAPERSHPFYWANLRLNGDGAFRPPLQTITASPDMTDTPAKSRWPLVAVVAAALTLGCALVVILRRRRT